MTPPIQLIGPLILAAVLLPSGVVRILHPRSSIQALETNLNLSPGLAHAFALTSAGVEVGVGGGILIALIAQSKTLLASGLLVGVVLMSTYTWYLIRVLRFDLGTSCGCGSYDTPVSVWTIGRATALALIGVFSLASTTVMGSIKLDLSAAAIEAVVPAATLGLLLWLMPAAMAMDQRDIT